MAAARPPTASSSTTCRCWSRTTSQGGYDVVVVVDASPDDPGRPADRRAGDVRGGGAGPDGRPGDPGAARGRRRRGASTTTATWTPCRPRSTPCGSGCSGSPARVTATLAAGGALSDRRRTVGRVRPTTDLERRVAPFQVDQRLPALRRPAGGDRRARAPGPRRGRRNVVLLGATGTGKSATTAWLVERLQRPTLVMAPNKTLAAQLANEFRELLPNNAVEYFVSYYDYYQPEAYIPQTDTYIEKDSSINDEVERLRHSATNSLLTRRDVIVVASVSCIYGLGTPQEYVDRMVRLKVGDTEVDRDAAAPAVRRDPVHPQRPGVHPRHVPGARRHDRDLPGLRAARRAHRDVRRRDRAADDAAPAHRRGGHRGRGALRLPGHPLRRRPGADGDGPSPASSSSWPTGWPSSSGRASCSRRSGCGCARPTTSR